MGMLISKEVDVRWNGFTRKWYEDRGYEWTKANDYFICKIEDLMKTSTVKVIVQCDYCGKEFEKEYRQYYKEREIVNKTCCGDRKCVVAKSEEVSLVKYGVTNYAQTKESKQHLRKLFQTPFEEVIKYCNDKGLEVLSNKDDYKNDRSRINVICRNHPEKGIQDTNFANIKKNKHCCEAGGTESTANHRRLDGGFVYQEFINAGLIPKFKPDEYQHSQTPLPYMCRYHKDKGIQYRAYSNLEHSEWCPYCAEERLGDSLRFDEDIVFKELKDRGLIPIEGEKYINKDEPIKYKCIYHPNIIQTIRFGALHKTQCPCDYCRMENSLSTLNRYFRSILEKWREKSKQNCRFKCVLTGSENYQVHHLYSYNNIIKDCLNELDLEVSDNIGFYTDLELLNLKQKILDKHEELLGVCIDEKLHILFHQEYGKTDNTPEQFEEFKSRLKDGEFNDFLKENNLMLVV